MTPQLFRERLRDAIDRHDSTWPELAMKSGYSVSYLQRLVRGDKNNPTIACVNVLAETLNVKPSWLLGFDQ